MPSELGFASVSVPCATLHVVSVPVMSNQQSRPFPFSSDDRVSKLHCVHHAVWSAAFALRRVFPVTALVTLSAPASDDEGSTAATDGSTLRTSPADHGGSVGSESGGSAVDSVAGEHSGNVAGGPDLLGQRVGAK